MNYYQINDLRVEGDGTEVYIGDDHMTMTTFESCGTECVDEAAILMSKEKAIKFAKWILEQYDTGGVV